MSTFGGVMVEFPDVRVDFFRPVQGFRPPLACFLSHVHSDHLAGLESFKSAFIYCSAPTKELLLRLERYPHRLNFERGILEARKQTYKHLQKLLKPIPLETPTQIELVPGKHIQVTLFDANHCTGAVMFLFEGDGKAVLYTGDIRSEPWLVNSLTRNPLLIEYTSHLKTLDCIYLDTSNTRPIEFPTKGDGIKELLEKVSKYPADTVFHFAAWTFGYEEVWMALARALNSKIHVDRYKLRLYQSLRGDSKGNDQTSAAFLRHDGPVLAGYTCGNMPQEGYLTDDSKVRLHSCEKGMHCSTINENTVWIKPIITRTKGGEMAEMGVGGGGGDLAQRPELEIGNEFVVEQLLSLFPDQEGSVVDDVKAMFLAALRTKGRAVSLDDMGLDRQEDELSLPELAKAISRSLTEKRSAQLTESKQQQKELPRTITFPYSRHSSYAELCDLVRVFRPKDVYACTVDPATWHEGVSVQNLFGDHCSASTFRHDAEMREIVGDRDEIEQASQQTRTTERSSPSLILLNKRFAVSPARRTGLQAPDLTQSKPEGSRPRPRVGLAEKDAEEIIQTQLTQIRKVLPPVSVSAAWDALKASRGSCEKAITILSSGSAQIIISDDSDDSPQPKKQYPAPKRTTHGIGDNRTSFRGAKPSYRDGFDDDEERPLPITAISFRRNSQGLLRPFDAFGNQVPLPEAMAHDGTPPEQLVAISPGSASQGVRRKAIQDGLSERDMKRARLQFDGSGSSPLHVFDSPKSKDGSIVSGIIVDNAHIFSALPLVSNSPDLEADNDDADDPESQNETETSTQPATLDDERYRACEFDPDDYDYHEDAFFDAEDRVFRCRGCHHEYFTPYGFCTNDKCSECSNVNYMEVIDPEAGPRPGITYDFSEDLIYDDDERTRLVGGFLDDDISAYDSQDDDSKFEEEYDEDDSMIDNASLSDSDAEGGSPSSDDETDWKAKYDQLQAQHSMLIINHANLEDAFDDFRRDVLGSDYESDDGEERDDEGMLVVDVAVPPPVGITEVIISHAQEDSQSSKITPDRIKNRAAAFEAATSPDGWQNVSLVSTQDNHTHAEIEL